MKRWYGTWQGKRVRFGVEWSREDNGFVLYWDTPGGLTEYYNRPFPTAKAAKQLTHKSSG